MAIAGNDSLRHLLEMVRAPSEGDAGAEMSLANDDDEEQAGDGDESESSEADVDSEPEAKAMLETNQSASHRHSKVTQFEPAGDPLTNAESHEDVGGAALSRVSSPVIDWLSEALQVDLHGKITLHFFQYM